MAVGERAKILIASDKGVAVNGATDSSTRLVRAVVVAGTLRNEVVTDAGNNLVVKLVG